MMNTCGRLKYINGLVQERHNASALAMELHLSCTNLSISWLVVSQSRMGTLHALRLWTERISLIVITVSLYTILTSRTLQWHHNEHDGVSNHQPHDCLLNRLFRHRWKKTSKLAFLRGIHWWLVNSPHKGPVTQKMFPFHDLIMKLFLFTSLCFKKGFLETLPSFHKRTDNLIGMVWWDLIWLSTLSSYQRGIWQIGLLNTPALCIVHHFSYPNICINKMKYFSGSVSLTEAIQLTGWNVDDVFLFDNDSFNDIKLITLAIDWCKEYNNRMFVAIWCLSLTTIYTNNLPAFSKLISQLV